VELLKADGANIGTINEIQDSGENISRAEEGMQVAISMRKPTVGRQIRENEVLYVNIPEEEKELLGGLLSPDDAALLEKVSEIKRRRRSV